MPRPLPTLGFVSTNPRRSVVLASYNVHGCVGTDGRKDIRRIAGVIGTLGADVVALQEVDCYPEDGQHACEVALLSGVPDMRPVWGPTHRQGGNAFGNALLSAWPVSHSQNIDISYPGYEPRGALDVHLDIEGRRMRIFATHLGLRPVERRYQVEKILQSVEHEDDCLTVLLGDINEWFIPGRPLRWLHRKFGWGPAVRTFPSYFPLFSLDRIWVHPPQALLRMWTEAGGEARRASDHLPVLAEVAI